MIVGLCLLADVSSSGVFTSEQKIRKVRYYASIYRATSYYDYQLSKAREKFGDNVFT